MSIDPEILNRKGARRRDEIPSAVLELLNQGLIPTANLVEWLAIDHNALLNHCLPALGMSGYLPKIEQALTEIKKPSTMTNYKAIGETIGMAGKSDGTLHQRITDLSNHTSDSVRGYACYTLTTSNPNPKATLEAIRPFAADTHFGVREIAWLSTRPLLADDLNASIELLTVWSSDQDENVRRYAAEVLRPNGVWCKHIGELKENPSQALPILEPLMADGSKYVRDSVANWLNDASKSQPEFVRTVCGNWSKRSQSKETAYIVKRALRTIDKK